MFTTHPEILGTFGVVSSTHWVASAAGMTLQICEPHLNGAGGDMPVLIHRADRNESLVVCG